MNSNHDYVERLNYSSKAIPDLEYVAKFNHENGAPHSAKWSKKVIKALQESVKFILPNRAELLDLEPPTFAEDTEAVYKQVDSINLKLVLGYEFKREL